ncbi:MAG TPA: EthD family reductase [Verrucomicrobiae bacterium]|nr:EthD family reductase [Verrucomicrobiae bacterium]
MIKVSILYPYTRGGRFDFDYYVSTHMPRSIELLSIHAGFRRLTVEQGLSGTERDSPPGYIAACFYTFDSIESFMAAFMPYAEELQGDMKNYTDIEPHVQINEIHIENASH